MNVPEPIPSVQGQMADTLTKDNLERPINNFGGGGSPEKPDRTHDMGRACSPRDRKITGQEANWRSSCYEPTVLSTTAPEIEYDIKIKTEVKSRRHEDRSINIINSISSFQDYQTAEVSSI